LLDYAASILIKFASLLFRLIPISAALWLGRRIGDVAFIVNKKRRLVAYANLKAAFSAEKSPAELRKITRGAYRNLLETVMEIMNLTKVSKGYMDRYVDVVNLSRIKDAGKSDRGTILLTGHFGDWELSNLTSPMHGFPITVLAREQKMKRVNELLNRLRESKGCKVVRKGMSTKNILKELYARNMVGILSDQDAGRKGMFVELFGRQTSCHSGPFEIAKRTGSLILPNFIVRTRGPYHKLHLEEYIDFRKSSGGDDVKENLQKFMKMLESYVRKYPEQWLWMHKRWKSTPTRTVLVLNDQKAGHLNQSLAVAQDIRKARITQGYSPEDTKILIIDIKYKNAFSRAGLSVCAAFAGWRCHGCMRCLRACLAKKCYDGLMSTYAEFVVSCGSSLEAVNVFMAKELNAKNIIVMKPSRHIGLKKFSLAVIPRHDSPPRRKNVLRTALAPNLIDREKLKADGQTLKGKISLGSGQTIGLLIGGDNEEFLLSKKCVDKVIDGLLGPLGKGGADFLVTTSRRTGRAAEQALKSRLGPDPRCKLLVIANENNFDEAVGGILDLANIVVVSGESISMVSEAVSSGKRVIVFEPDKKRPGITKYEWAMKALEGDGYIVMTKPENLGRAIDDALSDKHPVRELKDSAKLFEAVRKLI